MKKFLIKVNGNQYEVEVEEIKGSETVTSTAGTDDVFKKPLETKTEVKPAPAKPNASVPEGAEAVKAPMPGTVLKVVVNRGDVVNKGDVMLILEAMKMENEIVAPKDAKVASINVESGASVNSGDVLVTLE